MKIRFYFLLIIAVFFYQDTKISYNIIWIIGYIILDSIIIYTYLFLGKNTVLLPKYKKNWFKQYLLYKMSNYTNTASTQIETNPEITIGFQCTPFHEHE